MKLFKNLLIRRKVVPKGVTRYIHPTQMENMIVSANKIISQLNAAIVIMEKMKVNSCEVEQFKMYKKMFHETWLGVAEYYNVINGIDVEKYSDKRYIS